MFNTIWNSGIVNPMTNILLLLYQLLGQNFLLALVSFTALTRLIMLPLNLRQQRTMMKTQEIQPQIQAIQKKYRSDPAKMQEEFQKIGYNPADSLMGCLPLLIQMPIFFGLYRAILFMMSATPQGLYQLSERAYDFIDLSQLLPISNRFAWLNMAQPDPFFILPVLVAGSMFLQQKLMTPPKKAKPKGKDAAADPTASVQQSMLVTMPLMFGFFALQFPAGLSIYFVISNIIGIGQGFIIRRQREAQAAAAPTRKPKVIDSTAEIVEAKPKKEKPKKEKKEKKPKAEKKSKSEPEGKWSSNSDLFQTSTGSFSADSTPTSKKQSKRKKR